jgi:dihydroorotase
MLIKDVCIVDAKELKVVTLETDSEGVITSITPSKEEKVTKILLPLIVDLNVSTFNDSMDIQALRNLSSEALSHGLGAVALRPFANDTHTTTQISAIHAYLDGHAGAKIYPMFSVLKDEKHLSNIAKLLEDGLSLPYIYSDMDSNLMRRVMQYAVMKKVAIFCDLRDSSLNADAVMNEGKINAQMGLVGNTELAEIVQVGKVLEMAAYFDVEVVIKGISTVAVLEKIHRAKRAGVKVKAEVPIHHILVDDRSCLEYNTYAKIEPPLRDKEQVELMQKALSDGLIDIITSLHAPKSPLEKETAFTLAASGVASLEKLPLLYYTKLVDSGLISLEKLVEITVTTPSKYLENSTVEIKEGRALSGVLLDIADSDEIKQDHSLYSQTKLRAKISEIF